MMETTAELLEKALEMRSASDWSRRLDIHRSTLSAAKAKARLSPTIAGNIAIDLGADPVLWVAIAALEAEQKSPLLSSLDAEIKLWRKRRDS